MIWAGRVAFSGDVPAFKFKVELDIGVGSSGVKAGAEASVNAPLVQSQMQQNQYTQQRAQFAATPINVANLRVP